MSHKFKLLFTVLFANLLKSLPDIVTGKIIVYWSKLSYVLVTVVSEDNLKSNIVWKQWFPTFFQPLPKMTSIPELFTMVIKQGWKTVHTGL